MKTSCIKTGVVVNCLYAPIHEKPRNDSFVICELGCLSEVEIVEDKSIDEFYYVKLLSGDEGYCLKEFIVLR